MIRNSTSALRASIVCALALVLPGAVSAGERQQHAVAQPVKQSQGQLSLKPGRLTIARPRNREKDHTVYLFWNGPILAPMAQQFQKAIDHFKTDTDRFLVVLNSPGGSVTEGERVISILQTLKETHKLDTAVYAGKTCGSMCPFIYAQGQRRLAAAASMWLFHEVAHADGKTQRFTHLNRQRWLDLIDKYLVPAGISQDWLDEMKETAKSRDYFVSGDGLIAKKSGFITTTISDTRARNIPQG